MSEEDLREGLHDAIINGNLIPLVATSAQTNIGINRLLDFISKYYPSPADLSKSLKKRTDSDSELIIEPSLTL